MAAVRTIKTTLVVATGAAQRVFGPNTKRVALLVSSNSTNFGAIRFGDVPSSIVDGIQVYNASGVVILTREVLGPAIKASINLFGTATNSYSFTEVLEDALTDTDIVGS